jgi:hypothetical protein
MDAGQLKHPPPAGHPDLLDVLKETFRAELKSPRSSEQRIERPLRLPGLASRKHGRSQFGMLSRQEKPGQIRKRRVVADKFVGTLTGRPTQYTRQMRQASRQMAIEFRGAECYTVKPQYVRHPEQDLKPRYDAEQRLIINGARPDA